MAIFMMGHSSHQTLIMTEKIALKDVHLVKKDFFLLPLIAISVRG